MSLPPETAAGTPADEPIPPLSPYQLASASGAHPGTSGPPAPPSPAVPFVPEHDDTSGLNAYFPDSDAAPWPTVAASSGPVPASLGSRSGAFILDFFLTFLAIVLVYALGFSMAFGFDVVFAVPCAAIALNTISAWLFGNTLGQRMLGLRVVDRETGSRIGLPRTLLRTLIIVSPVLVLAVAIYSPALYSLGNYGSASTLIWLPALVWLIMFVVAGASGRSLHDLAARSTVVRVS